jgi:hypothetical protein
VSPASRPNAGPTSEPVQDAPLPLPTAGAGASAEEQLAATRALVGRLLSERVLIMDAIIDLVNAAAPYRHQSVRLAGEVQIATAWQRCRELCAKWQAVYAPGTVPGGAVAAPSVAPPLAEQQ